MSLPPYSPSVRWKNYEIATPTFQLTPVEKPDMSPFLVHMTGKNQILDILQGKNSATQVPPESGFLKACIPTYSKKSYQSPVVCFTESPTFALDFFRYRSFQRWQDDQRFGLGFDKMDLVRRGVRPVIYVDNNLNNKILKLYRKKDEIFELYDTRQQNECGQDVNKIDLLTEIVDVFDTIHPLLFPLLEDKDEQGFTWEREWRSPDPHGLVFSHQNIRVICCPKEEEKGLREILGIAANNIQFIRAWQEYDDVTKFLEYQQQAWKESSDLLNRVEQESQKIQRIRETIAQYESAKNSLIAYKELIDRFDRNKEKIEQETQEITQTISNFKEQLSELERKEEKRKKVLPDSDDSITRQPQCEDEDW